MAFDKYVKLSGSERQPMPGAKKAGACDPNEQMLVTMCANGNRNHSSLPCLNWWHEASAFLATSTRPAMAPLRRT